MNDEILPIVTTVAIHANTSADPKTYSYDSSGHVFKMARMCSDEKGPLPSAPSTTASSSSDSLVSQAVPSMVAIADSGPQEISTYSRLTDPRGPFQVSKHVELTVQRWGVLSAIAPDQFLKRILNSRGYSTDMMPAMASPYRQTPTNKQMQDYDSELVGAVRSSDLTKLKSLRDIGRSMTACNRFGESIVHMACRRADFEVVDYLLENAGGEWGVDDFGRTPLHDACWRPEPRFDIVTCVLDKNLHLLRVLDVRGANPLNYVREEHWTQWCAYLFHQKERYWRPVDERFANNII